MKFKSLILSIVCCLSINPVWAMNCFGCCGRSTPHEPEEVPMRSAISHVEELISIDHMELKAEIKNYLQDKYNINTTTGVCGYMCLAKIFIQTDTINTKQELRALMDKAFNNQLKYYTSIGRKERIYNSGMHIEVIDKILKNEGFTKIGNRKFTNNSFVEERKQIEEHLNSEVNKYPSAFFVIEFPTHVIGFVPGFLQDDPILYNALGKLEKHGNPIFIDSWHQ